VYENIEAVLRDWDRMLRTHYKYTYHHDEIEEANWGENDD